MAPTLRLRRPRSRAAGYLLLASLWLFWSLNWPAMKLALTEIPPWTFRAGTVLSGGIILLALARLTGQRLHIPAGTWPALLVLALFNVTIWYLATAFGIPLLPAARAVIVAFTMPVWAALLAALFLGERLTPSVLFGLGCGLGALAALIGPDLLRLGEAPLGVVLMVLGAMSWAVGTVAFKRLAVPIPTLALAGWIQLIGGAPILVLAPFMEPWPDFAAYGAAALAGWAYTCFVAVVYCHFVWLVVVEILPATVAATGALAIPVIGVMASGLLLGEAIGPPELLALALVAAAILAVRPRAARPPVTRPPVTRP